ncbi:MAG: hypothetical protein COA33_004980 [Fluviicola sp.]|nr:hypothetical protein [Fluviicola sp.]
MIELSLYIDIEGFAKKFETGAKKSFIDLTNDLFKLGKNNFNHLSIVQFGGDGFLIKEVLTYTNNLNRFIDIASALLQSICLRGGIGRVQISSGHLADISGLYSEELRNAISRDKQNILHESNNVMLINSVIGTSIINCFKLKGPSGPLLLIDNLLITDEEKHNYIHYNMNGINVYGVNWLNRKNENISNMLGTLGIDNVTLLDKFRAYLNENDLHETWEEEAKKLIHLTCSM